MLQLHPHQPPSWSTGTLANLSFSDLNSRTFPESIDDTYPSSRPCRGHQHAIPQTGASLQAEQTSLHLAASAYDVDRAGYSYSPHLATVKVEQIPPWQPVDDYITPRHPGHQGESMSRPMSGIYQASSQYQDSHGHAQYSLQSADRRPSYNNMPHTQPGALVPQRPGQPSSRTASRPASPVRFAESDARETQTNQKTTSSHHAVASYLHLPPEIANGRHASLAEFAANITCLFWFESAAVLQTVENSPTCPKPVAKLAPEVRPGTGFLKWVTTILTTTQVANNVVLLALLFIYRLKKQQPQVQGKVGSEFRLLTVALMLGNKFLDDNTYTNKTWADVSGISTYEVHVMEVEFLSHMKYNLYTSKEQWKDWFYQLNKFWTYFELATALPPLRFPNNLPSPPDSMAASPPYSGPQHQVANSSPYPTPQYGPTPSHGPLPSLPVYAPSLAPLTTGPLDSPADYEIHANARKRSCDSAMPQEPWPKRQHIQEPHPQIPLSYSSQAYSQAGPLPSLPSLPMPHLPAPYQQQTRAGQTSSRESYLAQPASRGPVLNPLSNAPGWLQGVSAANLGQNQAQFNHRALLGRVDTSDNGSYTPSPLHGEVPRNSTPTSSTFPFNHEPGPQLSPSYYLSKRTSPYRPVRNLNHLTRAPPSSHAAPQYPSQVSHDQIQWQPLKKIVSEDERRTGRVPYYERNVWPALQQYTPSYS